MGKIVDVYNADKIHSNYNFLIENKFLVGNFFEVRDKLEDIIKVIKSIDDSRDKIDILIDGAVIKINEIPTREELGFTIRFPKWALAYKFEALEVTTIVKDVLWQVGRTGKVTPLAVLEPVELAGATISRATLNNWDDIIRKQVKINSLVFLRRSNEVIPEILGLAQDFPESRVIKKIDHCTACGTKLIEVGAYIYCPNKNNCPGQLKERIIHCTVDMLYDLTLEELMKLDSFKDKKSGNILSSIERSKKIDFANFIFALGINNVGIKTAKDLARKYPDLQSLRDASESDLASIRDIGAVVASSIVEYFKDSQNIEIIDKLLAHGIEIRFNANNSGGIFANKTFVLTGTLPTLTRQEATKLIESNGGQVSSSVSKNTSFVLLGDEPGSKYQKALSLGVAIINEDEFLSMIKH